MYVDKRLLKFKDGNSGALQLTSPVKPVHSQELTLPYHRNTSLFDSGIIGL